MSETKKTTLRSPKYRVVNFDCACGHTWEDLTHYPQEPAECPKCNASVSPRVYNTYGKSASWVV